MGIARTVVIAQGKGGVGKTSLTANIAGLVAAAGRRACAVDLDPQGNLALDLGYEKDTGEDLLTALITGRPLPVRRDVRPRLDVVPGGPAVADLAGVALSRQTRGGAPLAETLSRSLAAIAGDYDLVLIDTPPGEKLLVEAALGAAAAVVVPTRSDDASLDGLATLAARFVAARTMNPDLQLAGVVLFGVGSRSSRLEAHARTVVATMLGAAAPVFTTRVRHLESAAVDARRAGLLVHELEAGAAAARDQRLAALRAGRHAADPAIGVDPKSAAGLAGDYQDLTRELLARVVELEEAIA